MTVFASPAGRVQGRRQAEPRDRRAGSASRSSTARSRSAVRRADVVVDAVFGTGFAGVAEGAAAEAIEPINDSPADVVAVDIASGVDASTGEVTGRP